MARSIALLAGLMAGAVAMPAPMAFAQGASATMTFTTLGTNSGPISRPERSEPANLVRYGDQLILVDSGDGAAEQLSKVSVGLDQIQTILISHLHFDHTGGLFAVLALRFQISASGPLTIYGPPGTQETVTNMLEAMRPAVRAIQTMRRGGGPETGITVVEIKDGDAFQVGGLKIAAAENSHYDTLGPSDQAAPVSLSFRFTAPDRTIVYTGDTGPSEHVAQFCKGADLLVSEIMDPALAIARIASLRPDNPPPPALLKVVEDHFRREHLAPEEVGKLAAACGVKAVVATHNALEKNEIPAARKQIAAHFKGRIIFAEDLQTF